MKLSPAKIDHLADLLLDKLMEIDGVLFESSDPELRHAIVQIVTDELMIEEKLDAEVHEMLQAYKYEITMGRMSYDDLFRKTRQKLIRDRGLVL